MAATIPSTALNPTPRRRRGRLPAAVLVLPLVAVAGILSVAWTAGLGEQCGGPLPGCGILRNTGDTPVTVRAFVDDAVTESVVGSGDRLMLRGVGNEVRVDAGQCLILEGGPFWNARTVIDRTQTPTGHWYPVDDWGARVQLHADSCPDGSR